MKDTSVKVAGIRRRHRLSAQPGLDRDPILQEMVRRLIDAYRPECVYLFGSRARGDARPDSDYDLLVIVPDTAPVGQRDSQRAYEVLLGVGAPKDVVIVTHEYFHWMLGAAASLPATVEREGLLLYAA